MRSLRSSKCLKTTVELTFTTQKANACSPWTACSVFNWKYLFWVNLVQKLKIISLSWNFVPRLIQICRIPWWCSFFLFLTGNTPLDRNLAPRDLFEYTEFSDDVNFFRFWPEIPFCANFVQKIKNCKFELKFCTRLISICKIMYKIRGVYFLCFKPEKPFLGKSGQKHQNCQFKLKFGTKTNLNMRNSMMMFRFSVFDHKHLSWANLVQKFKIACSKWNLIQRLIRICKIQWWCLFYLF